MRKYIVGAGLALVLAASSSWASVRDVKTIELNNAQQVQVVNLKAETYRTEYTQVWVSQTCSRRVCNGPETICDYETVPGECHEDRDCEIVSDRDCQIINGVRTCSSEPTRVCSSHTTCDSDRSAYICRDNPSCYSESYDCSGYESVPHQIKDHDAEAVVRINLKSIAQNLDLHEKLTVSLENDLVTVKDDSKKSNAILLFSKSDQDSMVGGAKKIESEIVVKAVSMTDLTNPLAELKMVQVNDGIAFFETKPTESPEMFKVDIKVVKPKFLAKDPVIAEGSAALREQTQVLLRGGNVQWQVQLRDIGLDWAQLPSDKYKITATLRSILDTTKVLNPQALPAKLKTDDSVKFKKK